MSVFHILAALVFLGASFGCRGPSRGASDGSGLQADRSDRTAAQEEVLVRIIDSLQDGKCPILGDVNKQIRIRAAENIYYDRPQQGGFRPVRKVQEIINIIKRDNPSIEVEETQEPPLEIQVRGPATYLSVMAKGKTLHFALGKSMDIGAHCISQ